MAFGYRSSNFIEKPVDFEVPPEPSLDELTWHYRRLAQTSEWYGKTLALHVLARVTYVSRRFNVDNVRVTQPLCFTYYAALSTDFQKETNDGRVV